MSLEKDKNNRNNVDFSTSKSTSKKVREENVDFLTIDITWKKVHGNNVDFRPAKLHRKQYVARGSDMDFPISETTLKK